MTVGDRATFNIDDIVGESEFAGDDDRNRGESFIDLDALERTNLPSPRSAVTPRGLPPGSLTTNRADIFGANATPKRSLPVGISSFTAAAS